MKSKVKSLALFIAIVLYSGLNSEKVSAQQANVSFQVFYDELSPYGQWVDYPNYGYVWIPDAGSDFVPYSSGGHWVLSNYGWTWVSDYDWGWAPFHYGRWDYDDYYGWLWVPDNEWGPSWVSWRRSNGYYGWAPMAPGLSISISFGRNYNNRDDHWVFVRERDFERSDIRRYNVNSTDRDRILRNSMVINRTFVDSKQHKNYVAGPSREDVQKGTGRNVSSVVIQNNDRPGQNMSNGKLNIYRPQVRNDKNVGQKPAPTRISNLKNVKKPSERNTTNQQQNEATQQQRQQQQQATKPTNTNSRTQSMQPQRANPTNNKREQKPNTITPAQNAREQKPNVTTPTRNTSIQKTTTVTPTRNTSTQKTTTVTPTRNTNIQKTTTATPTRNEKNEKSNKSKSEQEKKR